MNEDGYNPLRNQIATMMNCLFDEVPEDLLDYAIRHDELINKNGGWLHSRQVLACIIIRWKEQNAS